MAPEDREGCFLLTIHAQYAQHMLSLLQDTPRGPHAGNVLLHAEELHLRTSAAVHCRLRLLLTINIRQVLL